MKILKAINVVLRLMGNKYVWAALLCIASIGETDHASKVMMLCTMGVIMWMPEKAPSTTVNNITIQNKSESRP